MPIYSYQCPACRSRLDVLQKSTEDAPRCAECERYTQEPVVMTKQITAAQFVLVGSGWFKPGAG
jgi:putative FmdB family regulatory protein